MAEKAVAVLGSILLLLMGLCCFPPSMAVRDGGLVADTAGHMPGNVLATVDKVPLSDSGGGTDAVLGDSAVAEVSVVLINGDGEDPADVYGVITGRVGDAPNEIVLFQKSAKDYIEVRPGHLIPLSRSVLTGVPLDSHIIIRADLWDYDQLSPDDPIAQGNAHFPAKSSGNSINNVKGTYGEIQVKVIWYASSAVDSDGDASESESTSEQ